MSGAWKLMQGGDTESMGRGAWEGLDEGKGRGEMI